MIEETRAPRFRAYLHKSRGAIIMQRLDWESLVQHQEGPIEIDISDTPLASLAKDAEVVGSFTEQLEDGKVIIRILRNDPNDAPNIINTDKYEIWESVHPHIDFRKTVASASTDDDSDLRGFLSDYVFIVPINKGSDHHLSAVPEIYKAVMDRNKNPP